MNKEKIFQHFSVIIDNMLDNSLFFDTFLQNPSYMDNIIGSIDDIAVPDNIEIHFGASRACIIDQNYNYVVKFDMESDVFGDSLCQREIDIYRAAKTKQLDNFFLEPVYIGTYCRTINFYDFFNIERNMNWCDYNPEKFDNDFMYAEDDFGEIHPITIEIPLYAYPKVEHYSYSKLTPTEEKKYQKIINSVNSPLKERNQQIAMEFVFCYGLEQYEKLSDFMYEYNINDIHYDNIGNLNGKLICIDFAGYHSYSEERSY